MAGDPTIKIKIETDTTSAEKGLEGAAQKSEGFGSRFKSTFAGVLSANVVQDLAGKVIDFGKQSIEAYKGAEEKQTKFIDAMGRIPGASDAVTKSLTDQATALSQVTIYSAGQSKQADTALASFGLTGDQIEKLLPLVQDYAAKTGQDLPTAAGAIGKALLGQGRALKGVGIDFKDTKTLAGNYSEITEGLQTKVGGLAKEMGGTASGKMQIMNNKIGKLKVQLGEKLVPALSQVSDVLMPLFTFIGNNIGWIMPLAEGILAVAVAFSILNFVIGLFGANPAGWLIMLIAIAIVVLIVAIYLLWTHWDTVWGWIKDKVDTVWQWLQTTWDTITGILQAPFLAFWGWIQGAWDIVLGIIQGLWNWVRDNWPLILGFLTGPIGLAVALIATHWESIKSGLSTVWDWIRTTWQTVSGLVSAPFKAAWEWINSNVISPLRSAFDGMSSAITTAMSTVEAAITAPFKAAWDWISQHVIDPLKSGWNTIANAVNSIHFKVDIPSWVPIVGGKGFEWAPPHVPTLARGGLLTASGLVYAHAGEVISPAPASATQRSGPAIVIETANFAQEIDVDLFMRRASWEIQTQRI